MVLNQLSDKLVHQLLAAESRDCLRLVGEDGQRVELLAVWDSPCWAHLRDAKDEQVYVHPVRGSRELLEARYQELLGLSV